MAAAMRKSEVYFVDKIERFVEANLIGIELSESPKTAALAFRDSSGKSFFLKGIHLHRFFVSEFRESNIVDRLNFWDSSANIDSFREALCWLVSGQNDPENPDWKRAIETEVESIKNGSRVFANIEAIYGAQVLMLAEKFILFE